MTNREYISQKISSLGLTLNDADLLDMGISNPNEEINQDNLIEVQTAFVSYIPTLLVRPISVSEGGVSISRSQRSDIEAFYRSECKRLGLYDTLTPRVKFI